MINMNKFLSLFSARSILDCRSLSKHIITADGKEVPKDIIAKQNRITLINSDKSVTITDLKNAQNLSLRRDLKLVKIHDVDAKTRRPIYKLMTSAEYHEEELQRRKEKQESRKNNFIKGEKLLTLSPRITEHDLMTSIKKMLKLLEKHYEVRIVVTGQNNEMESVEKIYSIIENNIKSVGQVVQKRTKGSNLKFQLLPLKEKNRQFNSSSDSTPQEHGELKDHKGPL